MPQTKKETGISTDEILGKEVIDLDGNIIGIVEKIIVDPNDLEIIGIEVDKGFLKKGFSIGKNYIDNVTEGAVFLKIRVMYEIKGMNIFDKSGKLLGKVSKIELWGNKNRIKKIYLKEGIFKKEIEIPYEFIETIGYNIMLNVEKKKVETYNKKLLQK